MAEVHRIHFRHRTSPSTALFAFAFLLCGPDALQSTTGSFAGHPFYRAFFFSVDSFATIGYGNIVPIGLAANTLVMIEALLNILGIALATGVIFARFSRPSPKIIYSRNAIVAPYRDKTALEFRIANARSNQLIEVQVQVILTKIEPAGESTVTKILRPGSRAPSRRVLRTELDGRASDRFESPMWGLTHQDLVDADARVSDSSDRNRRDRYHRRCTRGLRTRRTKSFGARNSRTCSCATRPTASSAWTLRPDS